MECKDVIIYILIIIISLYFLKTYKKINNPKSSCKVPNQHSVLIDNKFPIYTSKPNYFANVNIENNSDNINSSDNTNNINLDFNYNKNYDNLTDISHLSVDNNISIDHVNNNENYTFHYNKSYNIQEHFDNEKLFTLF